MYTVKRSSGFEKPSAEVEKILNKFGSRLNTFHNRCLMDKWLADARAAGYDSKWKNYYEKNARNLITTWEVVDDYASRTWAETH